MPAKPPTFINSIQRSGLFHFLCCSGTSLQIYVFVPVSSFVTLNLNARKFGNTSYPCLNIDRSRNRVISSSKRHSRDGAIRHSNRNKSLLTTGVKEEQTSAGIASNEQIDSRIQVSDTSILGVLKLI